ncbi:MAG: hypothetical protein HY543_01170 [Deltaproteobacteria bacterium]|nr:hypothetical protein [Deltaproteobacteria bacterium]
MIHPLRDYLERRIRRQRDPEAAAAPRGSDAKCSFRRAPGETWTYEYGAVCLNGAAIDEWLTEETTDIGLWCGLVDGLGDYREWARDHTVPDRERLLHAIAGLHERALIGLRHVYDQKMGGVSLSWGDGAVLINNINVRAMLAMYHVRPTERARRFLEGLRAKLALILCRQTISPDAARLEGIARATYEELCHGLTTPTIDTVCLPPGGGDLGR